MEREKLIEWLKEMEADKSSIFSIEYIDNKQKSIIENTIKVKISY